MPKVKMLTTALGADADADGKSHGVKQYDEGSEYEVGEDLAKCFKARGEAQDASESAKKSKKDKGASENK